MNRPAAVDAAPVVTVTAGAVRGTVDEGIARFLGIPYAAAPFGADRFRPPRPHELWEGERDCTEFGPTPPQAPYSGGLEKVLPSVIIEGEEILNLNVWTPVGAIGAQEPLPVMVWVYGGALTRGSNAISHYDGTAFARDGVVLVAVNYRVGLEGFASFPDAPAQLGLADTVAALEWVKAEIVKFGGDPARVTVFGQSAGGGIVGALLGLPEARGLFAGAIVMSAPLGPRGRPPRREITALVARRLGIPQTREAFLAVPPETLVEELGRLTGGGALLGGRASFAPDPAADDPWRAIEAGASAELPVVVGGTAEEFGLYLGPTGLRRKIRWYHLLLALLMFRHGPAHLRRLRAKSPGGGIPELFGAVASDGLITRAARRLAKRRARRGGRTYVYEFAWRSPQHGLGAAHGLDIPFVFDVLDQPETRRFAGDEPPQRLADEMHGAWVRFAKTGDPGWPAWSGEKTVRVFA